MITGHRDEAANFSGLVAVCRVSPNSMASGVGGTTGENKKGEVNELKASLRNPAIDRDPEKKREVIKRVIAYMTLGIDVSKLFSEMIMVRLARGASVSVVARALPAERVRRARPHSDRRLTLPGPAPHRCATSYRRWRPRTTW